MEGFNSCDPNSFSNPEICKITDINLNLKVDFDQQMLSGYVDITAFRKDSKGEALILDVQELNIKNVKNKSTQKKMNYFIGDSVQNIGSRLEIKLPRTAAKKFNIRIEYETSPQAEALQWLDPSQTAGKTHSYMFSQCQAIHARSVLPCQDTPFVKFTYSASITVPSDFTVLMSALNAGEEIANDTMLKTYKFVQKIPIPSYLIAIAVGTLESRKIGPRSHIWGEKEYVDKSAEEFSETESMLKIAEDLLGPYLWEVYDLLMLPPSFAYGGMENPCITFLSPSLLAGDKSQSSVVAHEIAHSWTGNIVTNKSFEHFWINEGVTTFFERKICGRMYGEPYRHFASILGWKDLNQDVEALGKDNPFTKLVVDLKDHNPDDSFSFVPYEKGYTLLFYLETLLGGPEIFEAYLKAYVENFKFQSIDTDEWKSYLYEYFEDKKDILDSVDWETWFYSPGMPCVKPDYDKTLADKCIVLTKSWIDVESDFSNFTKADMENMKSKEAEEFLSSLLLEKPLSEEKIQKLTEIYELEKVVNFEIRFRWLQLGLKACWKPIIDHAIKFVKEIGRMKFVVPIYRDLYNWSETKELAVSTYKKHFNEMMYVTSYSVGKVLNLDSSKDNSK